MRYLFTFGCGSPLAKHCVVLEATDEHQATCAFVAMFSQHWSHVYPDRPDRPIDVIIAEWGYTLLNLNYDCTLRLGTNYEPLSREVERVAVVWRTAVADGDGF